MKTNKKILHWVLSIIVSLSIIIGTIAYLSNNDQNQRSLRGSMWVLQNSTDPNICEIWGFEKCDTIIWCVVDIVCKDCETKCLKIPYEEDDLYIRIGGYIDLHPKNWINDDLVRIIINGNEIILARAESESDQLTAKIKKMRK